MRRWLGVGMLAALAIAFALAEALSGGSGKGGGTRPAPALPDQVLVAPRASLASLRGKPAVIHFWASWCDPCRKEAAQLARLPAALGSEARVVGIDWNDSLGGARSFIHSYGWRFQNLRDGMGRSATGSFSAASQPRMSSTREVASGSRCTGRRPWPPSSARSPVWPDSTLSSRRSRPPR